MCIDKILADDDWVFEGIEAGIDVMVVDVMKVEDLVFALDV